MTILGVVLHFHPVFQSFVKAMSPMQKEFIEISQKLKDEIMMPAEENDPTAVVADYKFDWWNNEADYDHMVQFEQGFTYHSEKVNRLAPLLPIN
jgi:hypothetical protein